MPCSCQVRHRRPDNNEQNTTHPMLQEPSPRSPSLHRTPNSASPQFCPESHPPPFPKEETSCTLIKPWIFFLRGFEIVSYATCLVAQIKFYKSCSKFYQAILTCLVCVCFPFPNLKENLVETSVWRQVAPSQKPSSGTVGVAVTALGKLGHKKAGWAALFLGSHIWTW